MNTTTSQNPEHNLPLGSEHNAMDNRILYLTLAVSTGLAFLFVLILYVLLSGRNPIPRVPYGVFVSVLPALGALVVVKLTRVFASWQGAALVYFCLFVLVLIIQAFGR